jgi:hypothetical protein
VASCSRSVGFGAGLVLATAALAGALQAQDTGSLAGSLRTVETSVPIAEATIRIEGTELVAISGEDGTFRFFAVPTGPQWLVVEHAGYETLAHQFVMEADAELSLPLLLEPNAAVALAARTRSNRNEILRADISAAANSGQDLIDLISQHLPSLRIRDDGAVGGGTCVEYRGGGAGSLCRQLGLVIDGVRVTRPQQMFGVVALDDVERIELLSPSQASTRYGSVAGWGILLIETRRGIAAAPAQEEAPELVGFDWSEESRAYPWAKVLLVATATNAAAVSVSYFTNSCLRTSTKVQYVAIRTECDTWGTVGSILLMTALPSISSSLAARWAGGTPRSHGRLGPSATIGSALTVGGYVALLYGDAKDNSGTSIVGVTILAVAAPVVTTLADRLLRELR